MAIFKTLRSCAFLLFAPIMHTAATDKTPDTTSNPPLFSDLDTAIYKNDAEAVRRLLIAGAQTKKIHPLLKSNLQREKRIKKPIRKLLHDVITIENVPETKVHNIPEKTRSIIRQRATKTHENKTDTTHQLTKRQITGTFKRKFTVPRKIVDNA